MSMHFDFPVTVEYEEVYLFMNDREIHVCPKVW